MIGPQLRVCIGRSCLASLETGRVIFSYDYDLFLLLKEWLEFERLTKRVLLHLGVQLIASSVCILAGSALLLSDLEALYHLRRVIFL